MKVVVQRGETGGEWLVIGWFIDYFVIVYGWLNCVKLLGNGWLLMVGEIGGLNCWVTVGYWFIDR